MQPTANSNSNARHNLLETKGPKLIFSHMALCSRHFRCLFMQPKNTKGQLQLCRRSNKSLSQVVSLQSYEGLMPDCSDLHCSSTSQLQSYLLLPHWRSCRNTTNAKLDLPKLLWTCRSLVKAVGKHPGALGAPHQSWRGCELPQRVRQSACPYIAACRASGFSQGQKNY